MNNRAQYTALRCSIQASRADNNADRYRLERELQKKEKALAEAATLLMLVKKRDLLWPQNEET